MDCIIIEDLAARCVLGISEDERREKQDVRVNIRLYGDFSAAADSDRFENAVDYRAVKKQVLAMVEGSKFHLLEALAESIAGACLTAKGVERVNVRVDKPSALRFARSVAVEIEREKKA